MTVKSHRLRLALAAPVFALMLALTSAPAMAACSDLENITADQLDGTAITTVQTGLREALEDPSLRLRDGFLGRYTRSALARLCDQVPRLGGRADIPATVDLTREYAALTALFADWRRALGSAIAGAVVTEIGQFRARGTRPALPLRLAASPAMSAAALGRREGLLACEGVETALALQPEAMQAALDLRGLLGALDVAQLCDMLPVVGDSPADFLGAMARLARIEAALPGALNDLTSPDFAARVAENPAGYHLRLVGTEAAVLRLIEDYRASRPQPVTPASAPLMQLQPCAVDRLETSLSYYAISRDEIDLLGQPVDLAPRLAQFRQDHPGFDSPDALWQRLRATLGQGLDDCALDMIGQVLTGAPGLAHRFHLDPAKIDDLILNDRLRPVLPVLKDFVNSSAGAKAILSQGIRDALTGERAKAMALEVEQAAAIMAAAAEPEEVFYDIAPEDVEVPQMPPLVSRIVVTGATDDALATAVPNEQFREVLRQTRFAPATSPELIKSQVRAALRGPAAVQAAADVDAMMAAITPAFRESWSLTEDLEQAIVTTPQIAQLLDDPFARYLPEWTKTLAGIAYPNLRLFEAALDELPLPAGWVASDPQVVAMKTRLIMAAQKTAPAPEVIRDYGALQPPGCNCIPSRRPHSEVYGFFPFWQAPLPADDDDAAADAAPDAGDPAHVDFGTVSRIAFYGPELALEPARDAASRPHVLLAHGDQWQAARRSFVTSAHRFRARADIAFELRDWQNWSDANISEAADQILAQMTPFGRFESHGWSHILAALPTLFDSPQPDGATLIFQDYPGTAMTAPQACRVGQLISRVYRGLPDPGAQSINIGVDLDLPWQQNDKWEEPLFTELSQLLVRGKPLALQNCDNAVPGAAPSASAPPPPGDGDEKIVDKVLVFLQRPNDGSSQMLRYQLEVSPFQGANLALALRSIIPVLPPGAHRFINAPGEDRPYSGLEDNIVYFEDNFAGIGFWPAPLPAGAEDSDAAMVAGVLAEKLNPSWSEGSAILQMLQGRKIALCGYVCPNRGTIGLGAIVLLAGLVALTWRSFYSGTADRIAFRVFGIGMVWIGNIVLITTLFLLAICEPLSRAPWIFLGIALAVLAIILTFNFFQRAKNGPKP